MCRIFFGKTIAETPRAFYIPLEGGLRLNAIVVLGFAPFHLSPFSI